MGSWDQNASRKGGVLFRFIDVFRFVTAAVANERYLRCGPPIVVVNYLFQLACISYCAIYMQHA